MASFLRTLLVDLRLRSAPTEETMRSCLLDVLEKEVFAKADVSRLERVSLVQGSGVQNFVFVSDDRKLLMLVRTNAQTDHVALTITLEITADIFDRLVENYDPVPDEAIRVLLRESFKDTLEVANLLPFITRCQKDSPYLRTSDNRIVEYKFSDVLFSASSPYQQIQIVDTLDFGRFLILDEMANLAESDTVNYTHSLMNVPTESYKGKEVLILGGGDGGLIHELLILGDEGPSFVTMVDIDEMVMDACSKFMPSVCGEYLKRENREGPKHKIIAGDAIQYLKDCQTAEKKFDYIFGDLTDTPVSTGPRDADLWMFLKTILEMAVNLLKPNTGKYMTHCTGKNVGSALEDYEKMLKSIADGKCSFTQTSNFVNSFMETWVFYQISKSE